MEHPWGVVATDVKPNNVLKDSATGVVVPVDIILRTVNGTTVNDIAERLRKTAPLSRSKRIIYTVRQFSQIEYS